MYRASLARSFVASAIACSLVASLMPAAALAYTNVCESVNAQCTVQATNAGAACGPCVVSGFSIPGKCVKVKDCQQFGDATEISTGQKIAIDKLPTDVTDQLAGKETGGILGFINKNPLVSGLGLGLGMSLLTSMISGIGSSGSDNTPAPTPTTGTCTTQYYYTTDPNVPLSDPCAIYNPSSTTGTTPANTACPLVINPICTSGTLVQQPNDANNCPVAPVCQPITGATAPPVTISNTPTTTLPIACTLQALVCPAGQTVEQTGIDQSGCPVDSCVGAASITPASSTLVASTSPAAPVLSASPQSGQAPLVVTFGGQAQPAFSIDYGDGSAPGAVNCVGGGACGEQAVDETHTYQSAGEYTATLSDASGQPSGTAVIDVSAPGDSGGSGDQSGDTDFVPQSTTDLLTTTVFYDDQTGAGTPDASSTPLNQNPVPVPQGLHGNIAVLGSGATVYATSVNGTTEVAGFYGNNGSGGSLAADLCQSRPWSSNFLSYIIPPAFFDNICSWAGYPAGVAQSSGGGGAPAQQNVSVGAPDSQGQAYSNPIVPQAQIWAQPPSVSLGGRTTVFWTSSNVTSCTESSSDGNFSGSSTSGGASTVALSGPVTFTIQCGTLDGKTISDSATVTIGI